MSIITEVQRIQTAKADLKTTMKSKGVTIDETAKIDVYASKIEIVYNTGYEQGKSEGDGTGVRPTNYASAIKFTTDEWAESDNVVIDMPNLKDMASMFGYITFNKIKALTIRSETPITTCGSAFQGSSGSSGDMLERLILYVDFSQCTTFSNTFMTRPNLTSIEGNPIDFSSATSIGNGTFGYLGKLQSLRVVPGSIHASIRFVNSPSLDDATIQNIIDGLADLTGGTAQTLTFATQVKAKLTDAQKATITGKNWTLA